MNNKKAKKVSSIFLLRKIFGHLKNKRKIQIFLLQLISILNAFLEVFTILSILPFLSILSDPKNILNYPIVENIAKILNILDSGNLLISITIVFLSFIVLSSFLRLLNIYLTNKFAAVIGTELSVKAFRNSLFQSYSFHLENNSSKIITSITTFAGDTVRAIKSILNGMTALFIATSLIITLFIVDSKIALISILFFTLLYLFLAIYSQRILSKNSIIISNSYIYQLKTLAEGFGAIRDIIINSLQDFYLISFEKTVRRLRYKESQNQFIAIFPRYSIEAIGLIFIALTALTVSNENNNSVIPKLGALALASQRLLPSLQQIYASWTGLKADNASMIGLLEILNRKPDLNNYLSTRKKKKLNFKRSIILNNLSFAYSKKSQIVLENLNLSILKGQKIGVIGTTGSGKSTLIDIISTLLTPSKGDIFIDNYNLSDIKNIDFLRDWKSTITYVPQSIYLSDTSILENIALGKREDEIDFKKIINAAKLAQIDMFIDKLNDGYNTTVGEKGIRLSGGQIQRIGIARAVYSMNNRTNLLILDEATSALDSNTESKVVNSIIKMSGDITVIMIAHRLTTLTNCDRIIKLASGSISYDGPPNQIIY